jgi:hypothetical protein
MGLDAEAARGYYVEDYFKGAKAVVPRYWAEGKRDSREQGESVAEVRHEIARRRNCPLPH